MRTISKLAGLNNPPTLFEIRLDNDFIVFRGSEHESTGQLLRGTVVFCLPQERNIQRISLKLTGAVRVNWTDSRPSSTGVTHHRVDRTTDIYSHEWPQLANLDEFPVDKYQSKSRVMPAGNYEYPFELMLPGDLTETVEGIREGTVIYKLKASIHRGFFTHDWSAYKHLRVIRTLDPSALEFNHSMSVENTWTNKIDYSIVVPQKAVVFGGSIPLEARFTPLLKGLEMGDMKIRLMETQSFVLQSRSTGQILREYKKERQVQLWTIKISRDEHWQDMIEDSGQDGWVMKTALDLPRKLGDCMQDVNVRGIKIRHKLKMVVALINPDGHVSELRANLPVSIFISPNMPFDEHGNIVQQLPQGATASQAAATNAVAPPGYGAHILDQLYDEVDTAGLMTPSPQGTPFGHSRAGSVENLTALGQVGQGVPPTALSSRLQTLSLERARPRRNLSYGSLNEAATTASRSNSRHISPAATVPLTRQHSDDSVSGAQAAEHVDFSDLTELNRVPTYQTAIRTPVRQLSYSETLALPNYNTATSAPSSAPTSAPGSRNNSPPGSPQPGAGGPLEAIEESPQEPSSPTREPSSDRVSRASGQPSSSTHQGQTQSPAASPRMMTGHSHPNHEAHLARRMSPIVGEQMS